MRKLVLNEAPNQPRPQPGAKVIIGIDLSRSKWVYACRWGGQEQRRFASPGELAHLQAIVHEYQACGGEVHVVYEACGFGYTIAWWLAEQQARAIVVAPSTVERAPGATVKTDGLDASSLALKYEKGLLRGIYIPTRQQHQYRQLSRSYGQVLKDRRRQQVRLRLLLQEHGYALPPAGTGWGALERWLATQSCAAPVAACIAELVALRTAAGAAARRLAKELQAVARLPQYAELVNVLARQPGVGRFTAVRFILELGDVHRFATADSLPNYLGLTPREYSSGELVHRGAVRKCGPGSLRAWLVQCAWAAVRSGHDPALVECFDRLVPRAGRKKAIVAVARKLALRLRARWLEFEQTQTSLAPAA